MKLNNYTRSQLEYVREQLVQKIMELKAFLEDNEDTPSEDLPKVVRDSVSNEIRDCEQVMDYVNKQLETMVSKCIFCKTPAETEVATMTHICEKCDKRVLGRRA